MALEKPCATVVHSVQQPVQVKGPEQSLRHAGQCCPSKAKVFRAHAPPPGACENLLAHQQMGGNSLMHIIFEGLPEQRRMNIKNEPRRFIEVGNRDRRPIKGGQAQVRQRGLSRKQ